MVQTAPVVLSSSIANGHEEADTSSLQRHPSCLTGMTLIARSSTMGAEESEEEEGVPDAPAAVDEDQPASLSVYAASAHTNGLGAPVNIRVVNNMMPAPPSENSMMLVPVTRDPDAHCTCTRMRCWSIAIFVGATLVMWWIAASGDEEMGYLLTMIMAVTTTVFTAISCQSCDHNTCDTDCTGDARQRGETEQPSQLCVPCPGLLRFIAWMVSVGFFCLVVAICYAAAQNYWSRYNHGEESFGLFYAFWTGSILLIVAMSGLAWNYSTK